MSIEFPLAGNGPLRRQLGGCTRLSHAYLISGEEGSGRHTLARWLAAALVCTDKGQRPCGLCVSCRKAAEGIHPDIVTVGDGGEIKVDDAREMRADAFIRPNEADRKVYLVENAGGMNEKAQNAILKVLEDGPEYAAFLFLTHHSGEMLQTIRSRCEELKLTPIPVDLCGQVLYQRFPKADPAAIQAAARSCGGIVGRGMAELGKGKDEDLPGSQWAEEFSAALARRDEIALGGFLAAHDKATRQELSGLCTACRQLIHTALLHKAGAGPAEGGAKELSGLENRRLLALDGYLETTLRSLEGNGGPGHCLGWLIVSCLE